MSALPSPLPWTDYSQPPSGHDQFRQKEEAAFARKLAADDAARAAAGTTELVAIASFMIVDDPNQPEGRVVQAGQRFTVSNHDLASYAGRGVPPSTLPPSALPS